MNNNLNEALYDFENPIDTLAMLSEEEGLSPQFKHEINILLNKYYVDYFKYSDILKLLIKEHDVNINDTKLNVINNIITTLDNVKKDVLPNSINNDKLFEDGKFIYQMCDNHADSDLTNLVYDYVYNVKDVICKLKSENSILEDKINLMSCKMKQIENDLKLVSKAFINLLNSNVGMNITFKDLFNLKPIYDIAEKGAAIEDVNLR